MHHTIWHAQTLLGEVDLPHGAFVAGHLRAAPAYEAIAEIVRASTDAFLHLGLFHTANRRPQASSNETDRWARAIERAADLQLAIANAEGIFVETHFINLLEPLTDGVVVLVSLSEAAVGARSGPPQQDPLRALRATIRT
ncbi:MAG TPA: hypothetical protein VGM82_10895 [Gemmatimonadaceae bacterium]